MFKIIPIKENNKDYILLENNSRTSTARICLDEGARITDLKLAGKVIIEELSDFNYKTSYASSILFPFASRIKEGKYHFLGSEYQLEKNDNNKSALHGLVYNKKFTLFEPEEHQFNCSATFNYFEKNESIGFPFRYFISITYTLFENNLKIRVTVKNEDELPFPFTLGWHPYLTCNKLNESYLDFTSDKKVKFDKNLITNEVVDNSQKGIFELKDKALDDCYFLNTNKVKFVTPDYNISILSTAEENFLQLYTPKDKPIIAIEPMTGISNSFNNKIGLKVLESKQTFSINWNLQLNP